MFQNWHKKIRAKMPKVENKKYRWNDYRFNVIFNRENFQQYCNFKVLDTFRMNDHRATQVKGKEQGLYNERLHLHRISHRVDSVYFISPFIFNAKKLEGKWSYLNLGSNTATGSDDSESTASDACHLFQHCRRNRVWPDSICKDPYI